MTAPSLPAILYDTLIVAVGDVHGCYERLCALQDSIYALAAEHAASRRVLIYLGDYVDRGPASCDVIEALLAPPPLPIEVVHLLGNHEELMLSFLQGGPAWPWLMNGGVETCWSYGIKPPEISRDESGDTELRNMLLDNIPLAHKTFLLRLKLLHREGDYLFVHAGVRPGVALDAQAPRDLLWIRDLFLDSEADFGAVVVHGHTPTHEPEVFVNRIGIDTGACFGGKLTALVLSGAERSFLQT
ncbi:MAG: serine/threonine protein phosphatase [Alphaproteobacteria bacterium]|nr:serine/threonine protein phosphatase [Alphaproteobacteria bacterium]